MRTYDLIRVLMFLLVVLAVAISISRSASSSSKKTDMEVFPRATFSERFFPDVSLWRRIHKIYEI